MIGRNDFLCEACKNFNTDGIDGNHPYCVIKMNFRSFSAVHISERCPSYEPGVPIGYRVSMSRNEKRAKEIFTKMRELGIEVP